MSIQSVNRNALLGDVEPIASGSQTIATDGTVKSPTVSATAQFAMVQCDTNDVRYTFDGQNPAAGAGGGFLLEAGKQIFLPRRLYSKLKVTQDSAAGTLYIEEFTKPSI